MSTNGKRPVQREIVPSNKIEERYLETSGVYGRNPNLIIDELRMQSAIGDLQAIDIQELVWPTKEVHIQKTVQHSLPGKEELVEDTVTRIIRVPMTPDEAIQHYQDRVNAMVAATGKAPVKGKKAKKQGAQV